MNAKITSMEAGTPSGNAGGSFSQTAQEQILKAAVEQTSGTKLESDAFSQSASASKSAPVQEQAQPQDLSKVDILSQIHSKLEARAAGGLQKMTIS